VHGPARGSDRRRDLGGPRRSARHCRRCRVVAGRPRCHRHRARRALVGHVAQAHRQARAADEVTARRARTVRARRATPQAGTYQRTGQASARGTARRERSSDRALRESRMKRVIAVIAVVAVVAVVFLLWSSAALAQPAGAQAEVLFRQGRTLLSAGKVAEACSAFEESQKLEPAVTTLLNLAGCREKLGQFATAWGLFLEAARQTRSGNAANQQMHD